MHSRMLSRHLPSSCPRPLTPILASPVCLRAPLPAAHRAPRADVVCYSSRGRSSDTDQEASWSELAAQAGDLAKASFNKLKSTVTSILPKPPAPQQQPPQQQQQQQPRRQQRQQQEPLARPVDQDLLSPGLFGRAAGSLLGGLFEGISSELAETAKDRESVLDEATRRISACSALRSRMGNVQVLPPTSQSSSTMSINGQSRQQINLIVPVRGSTSSNIAYGQVQYASSPGSRSSCAISVQMPEGDVVRVDEVDASGATIDAEYRELEN